MLRVLSLNANVLIALVSHLPGFSCEQGMELDPHLVDIDVAGLRAFLGQEGAQLPSRKRMQELVTRLPKITETELKDMGHSGELFPASCGVPKLDTYVQQSPSALYALTHSWPSLPKRKWHSPWTPPRTQ